VTCLLKARIAQPEETAIASKRLGKHVSTAMNATTEELLEVVFSVGSMQRLHKETSWISQENVQAADKSESLVRVAPVEESPLLEATTQQCIVKT
jgi:hypothetical protein